MFNKFDFLGKTVSMYSIIAIAGMLIAGFFICRAIKRRGYDDTDAVIVLCFATLGAFIGSHLLYALTNFRYFHEYLNVNSFSEFAAISYKIFGGSVFYGGLFGGIAIGYLALRRVPIKKADFLDVMSFGAPLFHGIARIGCFFGGCCYGIESAIGFTAHGNDWVAEVNDVSRFPVQLLESLGCFIIAGVMTYLLSKKKLHGRLFFLYLICYGILRFSDEYLRGDAIRGFIGVFSTSQIISVITVVISLILFFKPKPDIDEASHELRKLEYTR